MPRILITAFEPYGSFQSNASLACLEHLQALGLPPGEFQIEIYPVDFDRVRARLATDLAKQFDGVVHLGQAPRSERIRLERTARNLGRNPTDPAGELRPIESSGPMEYCSRLPLPIWVDRLTALGLPAELSDDAGNYLCNASLYWTHHFAERSLHAAPALFLHMPLTPAEAAGSYADAATLSPAITALALRHILAWMQTGD